MPSGKVHDTIAIVLTAAAAPICYYQAPPEWHGFAWITLTFFFIGSLFLSDDLDLDSRAYRRWGALRFLWWPYQKALPHRSWLSHGIAIGPFLRIVYFITVVFIMALLVASLLQILGAQVSVEPRQWVQHMKQWIVAHQREAMGILLGLFLAGLAHTVADTISTAIKRAI